MDLKNFVSETIIQIAGGIKEAQEANTGAWVCPAIIFGEKGKPIANDDARSNIDFQTVMFDVAVTVVESSEKKGEGKMAVLGLSLGGGVGAQQENSAVSHIKFDVPIVWPVGKKP